MYFGAPDQQSVRTFRYRLVTLDDHFREKLIIEKTRTERT